MYDKHVQKMAVQYDNTRETDIQLMLLYCTLSSDNILWSPRKVVVCDFYDYINPSYDIVSVKKNLACLRMQECVACWRAPNKLWVWSANLVKPEKQQNFWDCSLFYTVE